MTYFSAQCLYLARRMLQQLPLLPCCQFDNQISFLPSRAGVAPGCRTAPSAVCRPLFQPPASSRAHSECTGAFQMLRLTVSDQYKENKVLFCSVKCLCQTLQRHPARKNKRKVNSGHCTELFLRIYCWHLVTDTFVYL